MMKRNRLCGLTLSALFVVGTAMPAGAANFSVRCGVTPPASGWYDSIGAAVIAAQAASPRDHTIDVYGPCAETVTIARLDYVRVIGHDGATLTYPASQSVLQPVLTLSDTRGTQIRDLTIVGRTDIGVDLVRINYSTAITLTDVTIQGSGGIGVFIYQGSTVQFLSCVIEGNKSDGASIRAGSTVTFGQNANPEAYAATIIQKNGGPGISIVQNNDVMLGGNVKVVDNAGNGVTATGSSVRTCCEIGGLREISRNGASGIVMNGGYLIAQGPLVIEGNGSSGIYLNSAVSQILGGGAPISIRENGWIGVAAYRNSSVDIRRTLIEGNMGAGVQVVDSSTAVTANSTIKSNGAEGVATYYLSVAIISSGNTISDNVGFDLYCTPDSAGRGTKDGVAKLFCSGFNKFPYPEPGPVR
jgi:hypothetical protein